MLRISPSFQRFIFHSFGAGLLSLALVLPARAQTEPTPAATNATSPANSTKFKARKSGNNLIYLPETVDTARLSLLRNQTIEVRGIISSFEGIKQRYRFTTDDGAAIIVIGDFPSQGGVTYYLRARVVDDANKLALSEIVKQLTPFGAPVEKKGLLEDSNVPLIAGGVLLLLAAIVTFAVISTRGKSTQREQLLQQQLENERNRARQEEERRKEVAQAAAKANSGGPGNTVIAGGGGANPRQNGKAQQNTVASRGTIRIQGGPHEGEVLPLVDGETRIGRSSTDNCQIILSKDAAVSSYHASIIVTRDGRLVFEDRSSNGSVVDGVFVQRTQRDIDSGSTIKIGASTLLVELFVAASKPAPSAQPAGATPASPTVTAPANNGKRDMPTVTVDASAVKDALATPPARAAATAVGFGAEFEVLSGPEQGRRFPITRATTSIGREGQDILLSDASVSRQHATLTMREGRFVLTDNGSSHGTRANGQRIDGQGQEIRNGDELTFGAHTTLKFHSIV